MALQPEEVEVVGKGKGDADATISVPTPAGGTSPVDTYAATRVAQITIRVTNPQKIGSGLSTHVVYTVVTTSALPQYKGKDYSVTRRYSDFIWLREALAEKNKGYIIPPLPDKNVMSRFEEEFLKKRGRELEKFLYRISIHPILHQSQDVLLFCTSNDKLPEKQSKASGFFKLVTSVVESAASAVMAPGEDPDEWFVEMKKTVDNWGLQLEDMLKYTEALTKNRREMGNAAQDFATGSTAVGQSEVNPPLANAMNKLGDVSVVVKDAYLEQANKDMPLFEERLGEYKRIVESVMEAFAARTSAFQTWNKAVKSHQSKRDTLDRSKPEKQAQAKAAVDEAVAHMETTKQQFEEISRILRDEVERFENERAVDMKEMMIEVVKSFLACEEKLITAWTEARTEVRQIGA